MENEPKFKYLISPDNTYVIQWDDGHVLQIKGDHIMSYFRREAVLQEWLDPTEPLDIVP